jgi:pseudouridylate synthase / pseudouridine kinase
MENGVFFPVPIPQKYEEAGASLKIIVEQAIAESEVTGINKKGNEATPWLLSRIAELSQGKSITSSQCIFYQCILILTSSFRFSRHRPYRERSACR